MNSDTAHLAWNKNWSTPQGRADWLRPEPQVTQFAEHLRLPGTQQRALDLGCGVGRHALQLARLGYETAAVDMAEAGLAEVGRTAHAQQLEVALHAAPMTSLPFGDAWFDLVVAFNVIYHGDESVVQKTVSEIRRVLKPGGTYLGTMISKKTLSSVHAQEISPHTFIREGEDEDDKHPHFYCSAPELLQLFEGFDLDLLEHRPHRKRPGFWHWHVILKRP